MLDLRTEREVVNQCVNPFAHRLIVRNLNNFKLLGPHKSIRNFFDCLQRQAATVDVKFPNIFKISQNFSDRLCIKLTQGDIAEF